MISSRYKAAKKLNKSTHKAIQNLNKRLYEKATSVSGIFPIFARVNAVLVVAFLAVSGIIRL